LAPWPHPQYVVVPVLRECRSRWQRGEPSPLTHNKSTTVQWNTKRGHQMGAPSQGNHQIESSGWHRPGSPQEGTTLDHLEGVTRFNKRVAKESTNLAAPCDSTCKQQAVSLTRNTKQLQLQGSTKRVYYGEQQSGAIPGSTKRENQHYRGAPHGTTTWEHQTKREQSQGNAKPEQLQNNIALRTVRVRTLVSMRW
jgi:hypothetical protein